jgi:hypothetical protein
MSLIVLTLRAPVGRPCRFAPLPAHVVVFAEPVGVVEGLVGEDVVGAEVRMEIAAEGVGVHRFEAELDGGVLGAVRSSASHGFLGSRQKSAAPILVGSHRGRVVLPGTPGRGELFITDCRFSG